MLLYATELFFSGRTYCDIKIERAISRKVNIK